MECLADIVYLHENWPDDPTIDFNIAKGCDPGFTPPYVLPNDWEEFCREEAVINGTEWESLNDNGELDDDDDDVDVPRDDADDFSDDDEHGPLQFPLGMRGP